MDHISRIDRLRRTLAGKKLDAILISRPENRRYLSGYSVADHGINESSGVLLIARRHTPRLLTDFRFAEQAESEAAGCTVHVSQKGLLPLLKNVLAGMAVKRLAFESDYTLHSMAEKLMALGRDLGIGMIPTTGLVENMRAIKSEAEIDMIREAVRLNEQVFRTVFSQFDRYGSEIDVALAIGAEMRRLGAERESFDTIVASGARSSLPHAVPGPDAPAADNPVVIDMGLVHNGYCSDMTRSFCHGTADERYRELHRLVRRAQLAGIAAVRAGVSGRSVDRAARQVIADAGYGRYFGHSVGHGVGLAVHEQPSVSQRNGKKLKSGMVITIEPGIYIPGWGGIRLEDMVVVREDGCENLNSDTTWLDL